MRKLHSTPMRANETVKGVTLTELISKRKVNNFIYTSLLKKKTSPPIRSQGKWRRDLRGHNDCDVNWKIAYTIAFNCTLSTKLRTFHFKFLHRRIATNDFLKKINLVQSDKCCFCEQETETIIHLFLHCYMTQGFWNDVKQFLFQKGLGSDFVFTDLHLTGLSNVPTHTAIDLVLLLARYHIHSCKLGGVWPCFSVFNSKLNTIIQIEKQVALRSYRSSAFKNKWRLFLR